MKRWLLVLALAGLLCASPSPGAPPASFEIVTTRKNVASIVFQQSPPYCHPANWSGEDLGTCVRNPLRPDCMWNIDDFWDQGGGGDLAPGEERTVSVCVVADWAYRLASARVLASLPGLQVEISYQPQALRFPLTARQVDRRLWEYRGCVTGPIYVGQSVPPLEWIDGANGGKGLVTQVTLSVRNTSAKTLRNVGVVFLMGSDALGSTRAEWCQDYENREPVYAAGATWYPGL